MTKADIKLDLRDFDKKSPEYQLLKDAEAARATAHQLLEEGRSIDALERTVESLRSLRDFPDIENREFRTLLVALIFDLSEIHFELKDYRQSEKELETLFKVLEGLLKEDSDRFGPYHILAMELSTRILRSRKKAVELLVKQQINTGQLYEKVNSGVVAATDRLVDSLKKTAQLLAASGDYKAALKFYAEAIKYSKKRTGRVTRKEVAMTIEMAEVMMRIRQMRPRAKRLLDAVLPHAIALETIELEENILALLEMLNNEESPESRWKNFMHRLNLSHLRRKGKKEIKNEEKIEKEVEKADK